MKPKSEKEKVAEFMEEWTSQTPQPPVRVQRAGSGNPELEPRVECNKSSGLVGVGGEFQGTITIWLRSKLAEAEKSLRAREQMEESYRTGTDEEWKAAAKLHPSTARAPRMTKADRMKESATQGRIAVRCRHDVEMFKTVLTLLALLGGGGAERGDENGAQQSGAGSQNKQISD